MRDNTNDLDVLLDAALKEYVGQEPPVGLERRVMRRLNAAPSWWRFWVPAAVALATVCLVMMMPGKVTAPVPPEPPPLYAGAETMTAVRAPATPRRRRLRRELPKPEQLSEGERALLTFLANDPENAHKVLREALVAMDSPAPPIEALRIEPLQMMGMEIQTKDTNQ